MRDEEIRKRDRNTSRDQEENGDGDAVASEAEFGESEQAPYSSSPGKRSKPLTLESPLARVPPSSSTRTSPNAASVLETTATPPHYEPPTAMLLDFNQRLLTSIADCDYETYNQLCSDDMSCMEPESHQQVVVGKSFHKYYFDLFDSDGGSKAVKTAKLVSKTANVTMSQPHIQWLGGTPRRQPMVAVLSYVKLTQTVKGENPVTIPQSETRVWELRNNKWKCVHFHKSQPLSS